MSFVQVEKLSWRQRINLRLSTSSLSNPSSSHVATAAMPSTSKSVVHTPANTHLVRLPTSTSPRPPIPIGMTTRHTPTRNLPNVGSHGSNPTRITTNSSWKPQTVVTTGSMSAVARTNPRTAIRFCD